MLQEKQGSSEEDVVVGATVPSSQVIEGVVFYTINVTGNINSWSISKRFSQFEELHSNLLEELMLEELPKGCALPPKKLKLFSSHLSPAFIEERRILLENYLKKLLSMKETNKAKALALFFTTDKTTFYQVQEDKDTPDLPDDVEVTHVCIPATRTMTDHVLYQIELTNSRKRKSFSKWTVLKRFVQFYDMDLALRTSFANDPDALAQLPPPPERKSKLWTDHLSPAFVEERRALLENYLKKLIRIEKVVRNPEFLEFIGVKSNT